MSAGAMRLEGMYDGGRSRGGRNRGSGGFGDEVGNGFYIVYQAR